MSSDQSIYTLYNLFTQDCMLTVNKSKNELVSGFIDTFSCYSEQYCHLKEKKTLLGFSLDKDSNDQLF